MTFTQFTAIKSQKIKQLLLLVISWGFIGMIYYGSAAISSQHAKIIPEIWIDQLIAFNPNGIWLYLSFFIFVPICFFNTPIKKSYEFSLSIIICGMIAGIIFILIPSTINYPILHDTNNTLSEQLWHYLYQQDTRQNCLPSLHGALTILGLIYNIQKNKMTHNTILIVWATAILLSVIQVRQHLSIDLVAGISLAIFSYVISRYYFRINTPKQSDA